MDLEAERLPKAMLDSLVVKQENMQKALSLPNPSTLRETAIEVPNVKWEDIGGLEDVKRELRETVQYPVQVQRALYLRPVPGLLTVLQIAPTAS